MHMCSHLRFSYVVSQIGQYVTVQQTHQQAGTDGFLQMKEIIVYSKGEVDDDICSLTCDDCTRLGPFSKTVYHITTCLRQPN